MGFECFQDTCYVLVQQTGIDVQIQLYSSFGLESRELKSEFELSFPKDAVSVDASRETEKICVQMIEGPLKDYDRIFLRELLACDLTQESINDVLLVSVDEKLMWIKYKGSFHEGAKENYSIETITSMKENIRGMNYYHGSLMVLDNFSVLTIFYLCPILKLIKKREILLEGQVKCFRFHQNMFIYSNLRTVTLIKATNPQAAETYIVDLKGIICFSVVTELNCIIAICRNQMFYYISVNKTCQLQQKKKKDDFQLLENSDIELIPSVARFVETEEKKLLVIEREIKKAQELKTLLQHLMANRDFSGGDAHVTFRAYLSEVPANAIVCDVGDQPLGSGFIEVKIKLANILTNMTFSIAFYRHASSGVFTQIVEVIDARELVHIIIPAENTDNASNKMSLDVNFKYDYKGKTRLLVYPINISQVVPYDCPRIKLKNSFDRCLEIINEMKM